MRVDHIDAASPTQQRADLVGQLTPERFDMTATKEPPQLYLPR